MTLVIGLPSKGRLQENAFAFFARAGLTVHQTRGNRDYRGAVKGLPNAEVAFLSASEIVGELARGAVHFGITGADLVEEALPDAARVVELLTPLGFGHANVVVAVPEAWIDVQSMADLEDVAAAQRHKTGRRLRVATKYVRLTRRFFRQHGIADYLIVESLGATEGAPAAGTADIIVDITTTGSTLAANALKVLDDGTILKSEAHLVAAQGAEWSGEAREAARQLLARMHAKEMARTRRELSVVLPATAGEHVTHWLAERGVDHLEARGPVLRLLAPAQDVAGIADFLVAQGADRVIVTAPDYVFTAANPHFERLCAALAAPDKKTA